MGLQVVTRHWPIQQKPLDATVAWWTKQTTNLPGIVVVIDGKMVLRRQATANGAPAVLRCQSRLVLLVGEAEVVSQSPGTHVCGVARPTIWMVPALATARVRPKLR